MKPVAYHYFSPMKRKLPIGQEPTIHDSDSLGIGTALLSIVCRTVRVIHP